MQLDEQNSRTHTQGMLKKTDMHEAKTKGQRQVRDRYRDKGWSLSRKWPKIRQGTETERQTERRKKNK